MKSAFVRLATCLWSAASLGQTVPGQDAAQSMATLFGRDMVKPAPPRAGDALLSCAQIAKEMSDIMRARMVRIDADASLSEQCDAPRQPTGAMMAQAATAMRAMNDPRLLRLALLTQEKSCVLPDAAPASADKCVKKPDAPKPGPANPANPVNAVSSASAASAVPVLPAPSHPDPFRPR